MTDVVCTGGAPSIDSVSAAAAPQPSLPPQRRPRVREVSSRFMSTSVSSSSSSGENLNHPQITATRSPIHKQHSFSANSPSPAPDFQIMQRPKSVQRRRVGHDSPFCKGPEQNHLPETTSRSLDTPLGSHNGSRMNVQSVLPCAQRKQQRVSVKLFKENAGDIKGVAAKSDQQQSAVSAVDNGLQSAKNVVGAANKFAGIGKSGIFNTPARPDTPNASNGAGDRIVPSRYRLNLSQTPHIHRSNNSTIDGPITVASKLLQSSGMTPMPAQHSIWDVAKISGNCDNINGKRAIAHKNDVNNADSCNGAIKGTSCPGSPISVQPNRTTSAWDMRSASMLEVDMLPIVSNRLLSDRLSNGSDSDSSSKFPASPCIRSLNVSLSSCDPHSSVLNSVRPTEKSGSVLSKSSENLVKMGGLSLPPQPMGMKLGAEARKGRKATNQQDDVHSFKLLHNHYLQWRYANAKAEASMQAQKTDAEMKLYSLGVKIADLRDAVQRKRIELQLLQRRKVLNAILEAQMPYLDEWSVFKEEYSTSLSGATNALVNSAIQLPVSRNIRIDVREVGDAIDSALKVMESIGTHVQIFLTKAEETDAKLSELARATSGARSLIEQCGDMLFKTYTSQVEECSLRGHLIQQHCRKVVKPRE